MGRDLLQSLVKAVTTLRRERRVTSCSVHPRRTAGTVPAAAASATCSNPPLSGGSLVPGQRSLGFSLAAAGPRSRRGPASPSLAVQPPAQGQAQLRAVSAGDARIHLPVETGDV